MYGPCEKCGKASFSSSSGFTLHKNQCTGPKPEKVKKSAKPVVEAPATPFHCEGEGVAGVTLCGDIAEYRLVYEEDEVEAFSYSCPRCKQALKEKLNPKKIIYLQVPKKELPKPKFVPVKIQKEHQEALNDLVKFSEEYWTKLWENPKRKPSKEDTQLLKDMIEEVSSYPGCEVSAMFCGLPGPRIDW